MPIIACNATMTALLRCVSLLWRLWHALFSDNTSCSGIAACQRSQMCDVSRTHQYENPRNQAPYASVM